MTPHNNSQRDLTAVDDDDRVIPGRIFDQTLPGRKLSTTLSGKVRIVKTRQKGHQADGSDPE